MFGEFYISNGRLLGSSAFKMLFFVITFSIFLVCLLKSKKTALTIDGKLWVPFFLWTVIGSFLLASPGIMFIWGTAFIVTIIAIDNNLKQIFPYKLIFYLGLIQMIGQLIQIENVTLYNQIMSYLFGSDYREYGTGYQGFTTNTGTTSAILIYTLGSYLYFLAPSKNNIINFIIISIIFVCIVLTGKRSSTFIVIPIPLIVLFFATKSKSKIMKYGFPFICAISIFLYYYSTNLERFEDVRGMRKVSKGIEMFIGEEEMDLNGREEMWDIAIQGYKENPLFGIGVSQFQKWSGLSTNPHNMYLQVLCEQGIAGLICFIIPLVFCLIHTIILLRKSRELTPYLQCLKFSLFVQLFFIIYGVSGNPTRNAFGYMMYFCAIGILQSYLYKKQLGSL